MGVPRRTDFVVAFGPPCTLVDYAGSRFRTRVDAVGSLSLPSGTLAVGDILVSMGRATCPTGPLPEGPHAVEVAIAEVLDNGDERSAAARIRFGTAPAVRWIEADAGAGVDSGTAGFLDGGDVERWLPLEADGDALIAALEASDRQGTCSVAAGTFGGIPTVAFSSGWGDGCYEGWWGLSEDGAVVEFVLDFDVLVGPEVDWVRVESLRSGPIEHATLQAAGASAVLSGPLGAIAGRLAGFLGHTGAPTKLTLTWGDHHLLARWRPPGLPAVAPKGLFQGSKCFVCDLGDPPAGAELWLAVVRRYGPLTPG